MSTYISGFDHSAEEDRAAFALGWCYWSCEWHQRRERATDRRLPLVQRQEALRCLQVASYWLERLREGGTAFTPLITGCVEDHNSALAAIGSSKPAVPRNLPAL